MIQMIPSNAVWGITQAHRKDFSLLAGALGMGARTVRIGFEDSNYLDAQTQVTSNAPLVEKTVKLLRPWIKSPCCRMRPGSCFASEDKREENRPC